MRAAPRAELPQLQPSGVVAAVLLAGVRALPADRAGQVGDDPACALFRHKPYPVTFVITPPPTASPASPTFGPPPPLPPPVPAASPSPPTPVSPPGFNAPRPTRPVTTVPRPLM